MRSIYGLTMEQLAVAASPPVRYGTTEEQEFTEIEKAITFAKSTLGRELLARLKYHSCEEGCDVNMLALAEEIAAKRKLNERAIYMLLQRFQYHSRNLPEPVKDFMRNSSLNTQQYFELWFTEFLQLGEEALHGRLEIEELFGVEAKFIDIWREYKTILKDESVDS